MNEDKFLHEIEVRTELPRDKAFEAAIAVLQELHDRLTPKEANDLAAQLPKSFKVRWHSFDMRDRQVRRTHKKDFVRHIADAAEISSLQARKALIATFKALQMQLGSTTGKEGEAWDVLSQLPKDLKQVWLEATAAVPPKSVKAGPRRAS